MIFNRVEYGDERRSSTVVEKFRRYLRRKRREARAIREAGVLERDEAQADIFFAKAEKLQLEADQSEKRLNESLNN